MLASSLIVGKLFPEAMPPFISLPGDASVKSVGLMGVSNSKYSNR